MSPDGDDEDGMVEIPECPVRRIKCLLLLTMYLYCVAGTYLGRYLGTLGADLAPANLTEPCPEKLPPHDGS